MAKYYFMQSVIEGDRQRLRALPGQTLDDELIPVDKNIQANRERRAAYPLSTVYVTETLSKKAGYYTASTLYPLLNEFEEYKDPEHEPTEAMRKAYSEFIGASSSDGGFRESESTEKKAPSKGSLLAKLKRNEKYKVPALEDCGFYVNEDDWYLLVRNVLTQQSTMLIGPTGSGKTALVALVCKTVGKDFHPYDMGSMYDPISGLLGVHRLKKGGESIFDYSKFSEDIQHEGIVLLDELSRAPVTTNNILFPCLDDRRCLPVEIAGGDDLRSIPVHEDCCFFATANVGAEYTGTMSMDRALVGRFFPLELSYLPKEIESKVLVKRTGIDKKDADHLVAVANNVRSIYVKQELSTSISTRETLMAAELVSDGWSALRSMELAFLPMFEGSDLEGERGVVKKTFMR